VGLHSAGRSAQAPRCAAQTRLRRLPVLPLLAAGLPPALPPLQQQRLLHAPRFGATRCSSHRSSSSCRRRRRQRPFCVLDQQTDPVRRLRGLGAHGLRRRGGAQRGCGPPPTRPWLRCGTDPLLAATAVFGAHHAQRPCDLCPRLGRLHPRPATGMLTSPTRVLAPRSPQSVEAIPPRPWCHSEACQCVPDTALFSTTEPPQPCRPTGPCPPHVPPHVASPRGLPTWPPHVASPRGLPTWPPHVASPRATGTPTCGSRRPPCATRTPLARPPACRFTCSRLQTSRGARWCQRQEAGSAGPSYTASVAALALSPS
jgi:hypothetical protein